MPTGQQDCIQLWTRVGLAALVEGAKAVPGVGSLIAAAIVGAGEYLKETISAPELSKQARDAVRQLAHEYRELLAHEFLRHRDDNTLELALVATLEILSTQGLSADDLVGKAGLDGERAAKLTLQREQVKETLTKLYDTMAQELTKRLVREYYRILLSHKDALNHLGVEALRAILERQSDLETKLNTQLVSILASQEKLLNLERVKAWRKVRWPDNSYDSSWGLQPVMLRPEYQLVDYVGKEHEETQEDLLTWIRSLADQPRGERIGLRCYVGPGGAGKTRLLLEVGKVLDRDGWTTGFLDPGGATDETARFLLQTSTPTLLVLDYVGTRRYEVEALLDALAAERNCETPYALVLLDRSEPEWLQNAVKQGSDPNYSGRPELQMIRTVEYKAHTVPKVAVEDLPRLYQAGIQGLTTAVGMQVPNATSPPSLPRRPLYVLFLALLAVAGERLPGDTSDERSILQSVWQWMIGRWRAYLERDPEMEPGWTDALVPRSSDNSGILEKLTIVATLGRVFPDTENLARFLEQQNWLPRDKHKKTPDATWLAHRIAQLLPSHKDRPGIMSTIEPDPLADLIIHNFIIHQESILDWLGRSFPAGDSTSQAALVFHRILASSSELPIEDTEVIEELCSWADHRLQPREISRLFRVIKGWIDPRRSISEQVFIVRSVNIFQQNISNKGLLVYESEKGTIDRDILSIIESTGA